MCRDHTHLRHVWYEDRNCRQDDATHPAKPSDLGIHECHMEAHAAQDKPAPCPYCGRGVHSLQQHSCRVMAQVACIKECVDQGIHTVTVDKQARQSKGDNQARGTKQHAAESKPDQNVGITQTRLMPSPALIPYLRLKTMKRTRQQPLFAALLWKVHGAQACVEYIRRACHCSRLCKFHTACMPKPASPEPICGGPRSPARAKPEGVR